MSSNTIQIHETAVVESGAKIGMHTAVWHFSHIEAKGIVGENCNLGQNTYVGNDAIVGNACRLGNCVSIFSHVELHDFVFCGPFMAFTHIAFPRAAVSRRATFVKTIVKTGATLGANATIVPAVTIGMGAFISAGATLTASCKDWALMVGVPARHVGWVSAFGDKIPLPLQGSGEWVCKRTEDNYRLDGETLTRAPGPHDILKYVSGQKLMRPTAEE